MPSFPDGVGLMLGFPIAGHPVVPEMMFVPAQLFPPINYKSMSAIVRGMPVAEARNTIAAKAIADNAKYVWFQGDDVGTPGNAIRQMIFWMEHYPKMAVCAGVYCQKADPAFPLVFRGNGAGSYWDWKVGELFPVSGVGMDCTLVRTEVFKHLPQPWFKTVDSIEGMLEAQNKVEAWTEDLYFCKKVTDAGWEVWCDGSIIAPHYEWTTGRTYTLPPSSKPMQRTKVEVGTKKIIDLGCGKLEESYNTPEGEVLRVDIRDDVKPDYRCDLRQLPFGTAEFDIVFSSHCLEHFGLMEMHSVLDEWIRLLKPDGELRLVLPNLEWAARGIMNKEIDKDVMGVLYGMQTYEQNFHKAGFTPGMIDQILAERGFKKLIWDFHNYHMFVRAWKNPPQEEEMVKMEVQKDRKEPVIMQAAKEASINKEGRHA